AVVLLGIAWQLIKRRRVSLFFYITAWVILLYSIKSFSAGHFMIFEKKYLLFIVPYFILAVVLCIEAKVALLSVLFVTVFSFVTSANSLQKSAVKLNPTDKNIIPNDVRAFSLLAKQVSTADSIIYTRWQAAHRMNYFLRPGVQQRVDTTQKANLIWIKSGNTQRLVEVK
ncbi:MAG TPA: hypothetical protein VEB42_05485, partial [Chitinophagaceae bacterium]|nr:hypothetical protein [Chitinophagaceae bacterium]